MNVFELYYYYYKPTKEHPQYYEIYRYNICVVGITL